VVIKEKEELLSRLFRRAPTEERGEATRKRGTFVPKTNLRTRVVKNSPSQKEKEEKEKRVKKLNLARRRKNGLPRTWEKPSHVANHQRKKKGKKTL